MRLNIQTDYAIRVLLYLAARSQQDPTPTSVIADAFGVSRNHMVKVVQRLVAEGYVQTKGGRSGGVFLAKEPAEIRIGDVVRKIEPGFPLVECLSDDGSCRIAQACGVTPIMRRALEAFLAVLDESTLADVGANRKMLRILTSAPTDTAV